MAIKIDKDKALRVLEEEVGKSATQSVDSELVSRIERLWQLCKDGNKTFIAMLGTALLAKATNLNADPFALKASAESDGAYSARALAQYVLAAHSIRLRIDLGVTGREPLNNQPFFAKEMVSSDLPIKEGAKQGFQLLRELLGEIKSFQTEADARNGLRAFISARRKEKRQHSLGDLRAITPAVLCSAIESFVAANSESGNRAQAVAAGLLDVLVDENRVKVGRVHDPDQRFPGDVGVTEASESDALARSFEVRDKPVSETDLYHLIRKASEAGLGRVAMIAIARNQKSFSLDAVFKFADSEGVILSVFFDWSSFIRSILFWSSQSSVKVAESAYKKIFSRLASLEVSGEGISQWGELGVYESRGS